MRVPWDRGGLRWYLIVLGLVAGRPGAATILAGVPLLLLGIAMHLWAKGCLHQEREVTTSGPYRYVRHPFYLGNLLLDAGTVLMSGSALLMSIFPFWWAAVYIPVMQREEATMAGLFGEQYRAYAQRVPLLFPIARPIPAGSGFSWRNPNILAVEVPRVLRFVSYPFYFALAYEWRKNGWAFPPPVTALGVCSVLAIMLSNMAAWQVKRIARQRLPHDAANTSCATAGG
jgi:protein-S-isoprenylcysteine O-methyltransferase Ste14